MDLVKATASHYHEGSVSPDIEKEFFRLQGDLYSLCRVKVIFFISVRITLANVICSNPAK